MAIKIMASIEVPKSTPEMLSERQTATGTHQAHTTTDMTKTIATIAAVHIMEMMDTRTDTMMMSILIPATA